MDSSDFSSNAPAPAPETTQVAQAAPVGSQWHEQDGVLREMWMKNETPQAIAEALGRSIPAIMTRAARLGLPRRAAPGRKPGRRSMDGQTAPQTYVARTAARMPTSAPQNAPTTSLRICLMCLTKFESAGRHNRICASCKGSSEYETASALPELHIPSS